MSFFQVLGMGLNLIGGNQAARAQEEESRQTAERMITDRIVGEAQAIQQQNMRYQQYFDDLASNEATLLFNRDIDASMEAFFEGQKEVAFDDLAIMQTQAGLESGKRTLQSLAEVQRGKNQARATRIRTYSNFATGISDFQKSASGTFSGGGGK